MERRIANTEEAAGLLEQVLEARRQHCRFDLLEGALLWRLVGTKAHEFGAVAEAAARDVVVAHLDYNLRLHRLPFAGALGAPAARPARRLPCKPGGEISASSVLVKAWRSALLMVAVKPT